MLNNVLMKDYAARDLLLTLSSRVMEHYKVHGHFQTFTWVTVDSAGEYEYFETPCEDVTHSDRQVLTALRVELRELFARTGVKRYAVAYPATATTIGISLLGEEPIRHRREMICIEAHDPEIGAHVIGEHDLLDRRLAPLAAIQNERGHWGDLI